MSYTESKALADTLQKTRDLTKWYFSLLKQIDPEHTFEINGKKLNSIYWIAAHLVWAENFLVLQATGGKSVDIPWLEHYKLGSNGSLHSNRAGLKEVLADLKTVHEASIAHILTLSDESLYQPNPMGFSFGNDQTNRMMIIHAIRHEGTHAGHLGWLCKLHGVAAI